MTRIRTLPLALGLMLLFGSVVSPAFGSAESPTQTVEDIDLGNGALGRYRTPAGPMSHIGFIAVHRTGDYRNHASTTQLQARGFPTLGIRTRFTTAASVDWEQIAIDVRNGVRFMRNQPGITKVALIAHSGGGPTTSYYQAVTENGPSYCQGAQKLTECPFSGEEFRPDDRADAVVFVDAHNANGVNRLRSLNGSVMNERDPFGPAINKTLDPFAEDNGFNPDGDSTYSDDFVRRYSEAQSRRMNGLIKDAQQIQRKIELGIQEDDAFDIFRVSARLPDISTGVQGGTLGPAKLLKNDGTIDDNQIVHTVRVPDPGNREADLGSGGTENLTTKAFLSAFSIRSNHSLDDIDWCSSNNSTICAVQSISVPIVVIAAQGHYFIRDAEEIYEMAASVDKDFLVVEGMTHGLSNCTACATFHGTGPYTNVPLNLWNYVAEWSNARL
jgi:hypothetical protein